MRLAGNELNVFNGLIFGMAVDCAPLILFTLSPISFFQLVNAYLSIYRASSNDGSELGSGPFDFPSRGPWYLDDCIVNPFLAFFGENTEYFIAAGGGESPASPVKAHVMYNDVGREIPNAIDVDL